MEVCPVNSTHKWAIEKPARFLVPMRVATVHGTASLNSIISFEIEKREENSFLDQNLWMMRGAEDPSSFNISKNKIMDKKRGKISSEEEQETRD